MKNIVFREDLPKGEYPVMRRDFQWAKDHCSKTTCEPHADNTREEVEVLLLPRKNLMTLEDLVHVYEVVGTCCPWCPVIHSASRLETDLKNGFYYAIPRLGHVACQYAMLDSGATDNVMTESYALSLGFDVQYYKGDCPRFELANGTFCTTLGQVTTKVKLHNSEETIITFEVLEHASHDVVLGASAIHDHEILWKHAEYVSSKTRASTSGRFASFTRLNRAQEWVMGLFGMSKNKKDPSSYAQNLALAIQQMDTMESQRRKHVLYPAAEHHRTEQEKRREFDQARDKIWKDLAAVDPVLADQLRLRS